MAETEEKAMTREELLAIIDQERLGLHRVPTYTGDYRWLCTAHYEAWQPRIPDEIEFEAKARG